MSRNYRKRSNSDDSDSSNNREEINSKIGASTKGASKDGKNDLQPPRKRGPVIACVDQEGEEDPILFKKKKSKASKMYQSVLKEENSSTIINSNTVLEFANTGGSYSSESLESLRKNQSTSFPTNSLPEYDSSTIDEPVIELSGADAEGFEVMLEDMSSSSDPFSGLNSSNNSDLLSSERIASIIAKKRGLDSVSNSFDVQNNDDAKRIFTSDLSKTINKTEAKRVHYAEMLDTVSALERDTRNEKLSRNSSSPDEEDWESVVLSRVLSSKEQNQVKFSSSYQRNDSSVDNKSEHLKSVNDVLKIIQEMKSTYLLKLEQSKRRIQEYSVDQSQQQQSSNKLIQDLERDLKQFNELKEFRQYCADLVGMLREKSVILEDINQKAASIWKSMYADQLVSRKAQSMYFLQWLVQLDLLHDIDAAASIPADDIKKIHSSTLEANNTSLSAIMFGGKTDPEVESLFLSQFPLTTDIFGSKDVQTDLQSNENKSKSKETVLSTLFGRHSVMFNVSAVESMIDQSTLSAQVFLTNYTVMSWLNMTSIRSSFLDGEDRDPSNSTTVSMELRYMQYLDCDQEYFLWDVSSRLSTFFQSLSVVARQVQTLFQDVEDEWTHLDSILAQFQRFRNAFPQHYQQAFLSLSLVSLLELFLQRIVLPSKRWIPASLLNIPESKQAKTDTFLPELFHAAELKCIHQYSEGIHDLSNDWKDNQVASESDATLIPRTMSLVLLDWLQDWLRDSFDIFSLSQCLSFRQGWLLLVSHNPSDTNCRSLASSFYLKLCEGLTSFVASPLLCLPILRFAPSKDVSSALFDHRRQQFQWIGRVYLRQLVKYLVHLSLFHQILSDRAMFRLAYLCWSLKLKTLLLQFAQNILDEKTENVIMVLIKVLFSFFPSTDARFADYYLEGRPSSPSFKEVMKKFLAMKSFLDSQDHWESLYHQKSFLKFSIQAILDLGDK